MKGGTIQISWHGSDPVLSVDFHPTSGLLATAGADRDIRLWSIHHVEKSKALPTATFKSNLVYHSSTVNVVRFSASGEFLASGADSGELVIWRPVQVGEENPSWKVWKILRYHVKDVLDLEWSRDGAFLVSASVDNTCIIWDVARGAVEQLLTDHQHYVQGVTWDPTGEYVVSLSSDRTCRFYSARSLPKKHKGKEKKEEKEKKLFECKHVLFKRDAGTSVLRKGDDTKPVPAPKQYIFFDENMASFFRRLSWSPDGSFLLLPAGVDKQSPEATPFSVAYVVSRKGLSKSSPQPTLQLPTGSKPVMGVRFCPIYFVLKTKIHSTDDTTVPELGAFDELPYRLVFAVATLSSVFIYETQGSCPIAVFVGLHYAPITDLAWSPDGKFLAVSSQDGYCTLIAFDDGELGVPLTKEGCRIGVEFNKTSATGPFVSSNLPHCSVREDTMPPQADGTYSDKVYPRSPGHVNGTIAVSADETLNVLNSFKQKAKVVKPRRICPKAITDSPETVSTSASSASSCRADTRSTGLQNLCVNQGSLKTYISQPSTKSLDSPVISLLKEREGGQSTSPILEISPQGVGDSIPPSCPVFQAYDMNGSACRAEKVASADGHHCTCSTKQIPNSEVDETRKPSEEFADIYVRPLKYRRITPKPVCEEPSPVVTC